MAYSQDMDQFEPDSAYFERRASEETAAAERANDERARRLHIELAERYTNAARSGRPAREPAKADDARPTPAPLLSPEFRILS